MIKMLIYELRTDKGLTLEQLAECSGVSKSAINNIENNKSLPRLDTLYLLAKALNCKIEDLYIIVHINL